MAQFIKPNLKANKCVVVTYDRGQFPKNVRVDASEAFQLLARLELFAETLDASKLPDEAKTEGIALLNILASKAGELINVS